MILNQLLPSVLFIPTLWLFFEAGVRRLNALKKRIDENQSHEGEPAVSRAQPPYGPHSRVRFAIIFMAALWMH